MTRGGTPSSGFVGEESVVATAEGVLVMSDMVERRDGLNWSGGRVWEEEAEMRGVEFVELKVEEEGGRTRLLRRKVKNAVVLLALASCFPHIAPIHADARKCT